MLSHALPCSQMFIRFVVFGLVGIGLVFAGLSYSEHQEEIAAAVDDLAARTCCRRPAVDPAAASKPTHEKSSKAAAPASATHVL